MIPFLVLVTATLGLRGLGAAGVHPFDGWTPSLRAGLALMFLLTASAHWGKRGRDLIAMVPTAFPRPDLVVTITGILEVLGAAGLLLPATAPAAAACLALLLIAMFPANVRAAREGLQIGGAAATALPVRTVLQIVFIGALVVAGFPSAFRLDSGSPPTPPERTKGPPAANLERIYLTAGGEVHGTNAETQSAERLT